MTTARDRLALALDFDGLPEAEALVAEVGHWFGIIKIGLELYAAAGPEAFERFASRGFRVFADLKLHDIPHTVGRCAQVLGRSRVDFVTLHAAGGREMLMAGVEGLRAGASAAGHPPPVALAVTVLTSDPDASAVPARLALAAATGCDGVVCSAGEARSARDAGLRVMVPGIRPPGTQPGDQRRVATPAAAIAAGADWLVVGRAVTAAASPATAAATLYADVEEALRRARRAE